MGNRRRIPRYDRPLVAIGGRRGFLCHLVMAYATVIPKGVFDREGGYISFRPPRLLALFIIYRAQARLDFFAFPFRLALT